MNQRKKLDDKLDATEAGRSLKLALEKAGGPKGLRDLLSIPKQTVDNWIYIQSRVSRRGAIAIDALNIGVTKEQLRPDVKDWTAAGMPQKCHADEAAKTPRGRALLKLLETTNGSAKAFARLIGVRSIAMWVERGYVPQRHVDRIIALPEFNGLTRADVRPDLHELDYEESAA